MRAKYTLKEVQEMQFIQAYPLTSVSYYIGNTAEKALLAANTNEPTWFLSSDGCSFIRPSENGEESKAVLGSYCVIKKDMCSYEPLPEAVLQKLAKNLFRHIESGVFTNLDFSDVEPWEVMRQFHLYEENKKIIPGIYQYTWHDLLCPSFEVCQEINLDCKNSRYLCIPTSKASNPFDAVRMLNVDVQRQVEGNSSQLTAITGLIPPKREGDKVEVFLDTGDEVIADYFVKDVNFRLFRLLWPDYANA